MPKTLDLRKKEFDANHAYEVMVKRIRDEALEEVIQELQKMENLYSFSQPGHAVGVVRALK